VIGEKEKMVRRTGTTLPDFGKFFSWGRNKKIPGQNKARQEIRTKRGRGTPIGHEKQGRRQKDQQK